MFEVLIKLHSAHVVACGNAFVCAGKNAADKNSVPDPIIFSFLFFAGASENIPKVAAAGEKYQQEELFTDGPLSRFSLVCAALYIRDIILAWRRASGRLKSLALLFPILCTVIIS